MRFVSPALKRIVFPALSRSGYLRCSAGVGPTIVTYHGVLPAGYRVQNRALDGNLISVDSLRQQLGLLKKSYNVITPEDFLHWLEEKMPLPPHSVLLTCDDALRNTLTEMVPVLHELGMSCLFFATGASGDETSSMLWYEELYLMLLEAREPITISLSEAGVSVGGIPPNKQHASWWNLVEQLSRFDRELRRNFLDQIGEQLGLSGNWRERFLQDQTLAGRFLVLDVAGLRQLVAAGMTIGAHSLSHPILARVSEELAWREISESRSITENALGQAVWAFAYPFGNPAMVTARDVRLAEQAGFQCAFMNTEAGLAEKTNRFALPRVHITGDMSLFEFEAHISGFYSSLRKRLLGGDP